MAKKGFGKFVAFAAISGAVAAGVSYVLQYKIYHKELDKDFREFEEDEEDEDASQSDSFDPRNYISLNSSRDEFKMAAKDMASATKNVLKDAGNLFSDTAHEAVSAAVDTAHIAIHSMKAKKDDLFEEEDDPKKGDSFTEEDYLDDDYVDDDDLYDYERLDHSPSPAKEENISVSVNPEAADDLEEESEEKEETAKAAEPEKETATIEEDTI